MAENNPDLVKLVQELAASGDVPITAPDGTPRTLRQAIADVFDKTRRVLRLAGRPVDPRDGDDLFGHVLSIRAEVQILRTLITKMADQQGINTDDLVNQTLEALQ